MLRLDKLLTKFKEIPTSTVMLTAGLLLAAGFETTASLVTATLYLLLRHPSCLEKVTKELRSSFKSQDEISLASLEKEEYMIACLNEALRWYPPVASGMPREVMKGGTSIAGYYIPESVSLPCSQPERGRLADSLSRRSLPYLTGQPRTHRRTSPDQTNIILSAG